MKKTAKLLGVLVLALALAVSMMSFAFADDEAEIITYSNRGMMNPVDRANFEQAYKEINDSVPEGNVVCYFGCLVDEGDVTVDMKSRNIDPNTIVGMKFTNGTWSDAPVVNNGDGTVTMNSDPGPILMMIPSNPVIVVEPETEKIVTPGDSVTKATETIVTVGEGTVIEIGSFGDRGGMPEEEQKRFEDANNSLDEYVPEGFTCEYMGYLTKSESVKPAFNMSVDLSAYGVTIDSDVIVKRFDKEAGWVEQMVANNGDGVVTCTFDDFGPFAIYLAK